ncbi:hypothetical protein [Pontibacter beigongshangensis]|uniref:hypothetical protein n=1 Tax=Pontibacter beigongshangensis TaxID=2574733 RepID=UPI00164FCAD4|nr:hypothetical protein [Pontibacter beigongshangensis]
MKKKLYYLLLAVVPLTQSCTSQKALYSSYNYEKMDKEYQERIIDVIKLDSSLSEPTVVQPVTGSSFPVNLQLELVKIFDPTNNRCNCGGQFIKKLKKIKLDNTDGTGFIPKIVQNNVKAVDAFALSKSGGTVLAHSFTFTNSAGKESKIIYARDAPTRINFSEANYLMSGEGEYDSFIYNLDCSGYISAAVSASGGINSASIESAAKSATTVNNSMMVVGGVMASPLYQAYKGEGEFGMTDKQALTKRINVLNAILNEIPTHERIDSNKINLIPNYEVILASNKGESSFNGEGKITSSAGATVGVASFTSDVSTGGAINRKSSYKNYNTYITGTSIGKLTDIITVKSLKDLVSSLTTSLAKL